MGPSAGYEELCRIINHVFLPPELPQEEEESCEIALIDTVIAALSSMLERLSSKPEAVAMRNAITLMKNLKAANDLEDAATNENGVNHVLTHLQDEQTMAVKITAQNSAVMITKKANTFVFEQFELSPDNKAVITTKGRLIRDFPASAIAVDAALIDEAGFTSTVANTLSTLCHKAGPESQQTSKKAGAEHEEDRDTPQPSLVSEFFFSILRGIGRPADVSTISKYTKEEVLWKDARRPWRRSPIWLLIRVTLQLVISRSSDGSRELYKKAMAYIMSYIIDMMKCFTLSPDLVYIMIAKVVRRQQKLLHEDSTSMNDPIGEDITNTLVESLGSLSSRWSKVQINDIRDPSLAALEGLDFKKDTYCALPELEAYIMRTKNRQPSRNTTEFTPSSQLLKYSDEDLPLLPQSFPTDSAYVAANLQQFERWIALHLDDWLSNNKGSDVCEKLYVLMRDYHSLAQRIYSGNPEANSVMVLTIFEIWVGCDKAAVDNCRMIADYDPGIPHHDLENLLLPYLDQMERLVKVESHLSVRAGKYPTSYLFGTGGRNCFASRYVGGSSEHQALLAKINSEARTSRDRKREELCEAQAEYRRLDELYDSSECEYFTKVIDDFCDPPETEDVHKNTCSKCRLRQQRDSISVQVHEWPLPSDPVEEKVVILELRVPPWLCSWRNTQFYLLNEVLQVEHRPAVISKYHLSSNDPHLTDLHFQRTYHQRIDLMSTNKPMVNTHYSAKRVMTMTESSICVRNGLKYSYYDKETKTYINDFTFTNFVARNCTYKSHHKDLDTYIFRPASSPDGVEPNVVIANQHECPDTASLEEYKDLSTVPLGRHVQWANILLQLAMPTVDFKKPDTTLVFLQCIYQAGPPDDQTLRDAHHVLKDDRVACSILDNLNAALERVKANWESVQALSTFTSIALRVLSLNETAREGAVEFLGKARSVAASWVETLRDKAHGATDHTDRTEFIRKAVEAALVCICTLDVDEIHLNQVLASESDISTLVRMSIVIQEGKHSRASGNGYSSILDLRFKRLLYRAHRIVSQNQSALDDAIKQSWAGYNPGAGWERVSAQKNHWMCTQTSDVHGATLTVHYDLLTGELLVNGLPLAQPQKDYREHGLYSVLFGQAIVEVMPSSTPGFDFSAKRCFGGYEVQLGLDSTTQSAEKQLIVRAIGANQTFETLSSRYLANRYPHHFLQDYVQWLNLETGDVEFRPLEDPWNSQSPAKWTLSKTVGEGWRMETTQKSLVGLQTRTSKSIARVLEPLAYDRKIHCSLQSAGSPLKIDIPSLRIGFLLEPGTQKLQSREFRSMAVDEDQSLGTLVGFENKLMLASKTGDRTILLPQSTVSYMKQGDHVQVNVAKDTATAVHSVEVDKSLCRLVDNGDRGCKLYLAYLHALTSFPLPDPLTLKTGTEQALVILKSKAIESFDQLSQADVEQLERLAQLSPVRAYYPAHERVMQTVKWDTNLGVLSQHGRFITVVASILEEAVKMRIFFPNCQLRLPVLRNTDGHLGIRDNIRSATFRVSEFGAEDFVVTHDVHYASRDKASSSQRTSNVAQLSNLLTRGGDDRHWPAVTLQSLWNNMTELSLVHGRDTEIVSRRIRYDPDLLGAGESSILARLLAYQRWLTSPENARRYKFSILTWLCTIAYADSANMSIIQLFALFAKSPQLSHIEQPDPAVFEPRSDRHCNISTLKSLVSQSRRDFETCPEYQIARWRNERAHEYRSRRQQAWREKSNSTVDLFTTSLTKQWPCKKPKTPTVPDGSKYIKVDSAISDSREIFKKWRNNGLLYTYLEDLTATLSSLRQNNVSLSDISMDYTFCSTHSSIGCVSSNDLFSNPAPKLPTRQPNLEAFAQEQTMAVGSNVPLLGKLIQFLDGLASNSRYEAEYVADLRTSLLALNGRQEPDSILADSLPDLLRTYLVDCQLQVENTYNVLVAAVSKSATASHALTLECGPRISPTFFLQQLARDRWEGLSPDWKACIVAYGLALTETQRAGRLVKLTGPSRREDLKKELRELGHTNWSPFEYPETLLIEVENGILVRGVQEQVAAQMRKPSTGRSSVLQLNMGEGKSSVIIPIVAAYLANPSQLVRVIVGRPQSKQMAQMLISKLGGLVNRRVFFMPFSRSLRLDAAAANTVSSLLRTCMATGGILLVQPEHLLSFKLMAPECYLTDKTEVGRSLMSTQDFLDDHSRDIVDESDENFSVRFELIYTMGSQRPIEMTPGRWLVLQQVLNLVKVVALSIVEQLPSSIEVKPGVPGSFPRIRILRENAKDLLVEQVAQYVCDGKLDGLQLSRHRRRVREAVVVYLTQPDLEEEEISAVEDENLWSESTSQRLLLLRGLLAGGILAFALGQKRWRVNYGLADRDPPTKLAIPYRAKDSPSARSEFSHPEVVITLTCLSYYYGGLSDKDLFTALGHLLISDQADSEYQVWLQDAHEIPSGFRQLQGINLKDRPQCISELFPSLRHAKSVVDYFLSHILFPKEMKEFPYKISSSGWDLGKRKGRVLTGFSGTNDTRCLLPLDVDFLDLDEQKHTNALVLEHLLQPVNGVHLMTDVDKDTTDADHLLSAVLQLDPPVQVVLDVGAQILELTNLQVASTWLGRHDFTKEAVVFVDEQDDLQVVDRTGHKEPLRTSHYLTRLDSCLVFLDESHTRGIDLKLPTNYRAAVTLGANLTKDRLVQACMRMRKLGLGQTVVFCISKEIQAKICESTMKTSACETITLSDVLAWAILESHKDVRRSMPLWAVQGQRFIWQKRIWEDAKENGKTTLTEEIAAKLQEKEAQSIEDRYQPRQDHGQPSYLTDTEDKDLARIADKCRRFDNLQFNSTTLQEEQERELSPEMEQERQVQRAPPAEPAKHQLHKDVLIFFETGVVKPASKAYAPAFQTLANTSAAKLFPVAELCEGTALFATTDFATTVTTRGKNHVSDVFERSVQWLLTSCNRNDGVVDSVMIISPYEANQLYRRMHETTATTLHLFKPRCNLGYGALDNLDFHTVSGRSRPPVVPRSLAVQLGLFAGQLYISSYGDYLELCNFLGLSPRQPNEEMEKQGWRFDSEGFIKCDDQNRTGGTSGLSKSPVPFAQTLISKIRRNGESIARTHYGRMLQGQVLEQEDFEQQG